MKLLYTPVTVDLVNETNRTIYFYSDQEFISWKGNETHERCGSNAEKLRQMHGRILIPILKRIRTEPGPVGVAGRLALVPEREILPVSSTQVASKLNNSALTFQELLFRLQSFWADRGCILQQPYDVEVGAGTMAPETFLRVLGPKPYRVGYAQPSRRPADGRYGENPNRLFKHTQFQLILKPPPVNVQELYLQSLEAIGIDLSKHDLKFEEDNWEWPAGGAWGVGWQVMLDGLEITQFTYFQQCGGLDLDPICAELTYGLERITQFLQDVDSIYDIVWARDPETGKPVTYGEVRLAEELQFSVYNFEDADVTKLWQHFNEYEAEAKELLDKANTLLADENATAKDKRRFPLLPTYELALKCSNLFNVLDARGAISVTERVGVIGRIRALAVGVAKAYALQEAS
jgi:glycyl-tRNA synthetase alpha chain